MTLPPPIPPSPLSPQLEAEAREAHEAGARQLIALLEEEAAHLMARKRQLEPRRDSHSPSPFVPQARTEPEKAPAPASRTRHLRRML